MINERSAMDLGPGFILVSPSWIHASYYIKWDMGFSDFPQQGLCMRACACACVCLCVRVRACVRVCVGAASCTRTQWQWESNLFIGLPGQCSQHLLFHLSTPKKHPRIIESIRPVQIGNVKYDFPAYILY